MSVDRTRRDAAAAALASFLRGEANRDALSAEFDRIFRAGTRPDNWDWDTYLEGFLGSWLSFGARRPVTERDWLEMSRHLAFLKTNLEASRSPISCHGEENHQTNLEASRSPIPCHEEENHPRKILLARWHTLGLLVAFGVSCWTSWLLFAYATFVSFVLYQRSEKIMDFPMEEEKKKEIERRQEYHPFHDQVEWLAHKHLVDECHLPAYEAVVFAQPPSVQSPRSKWFAELVDTFCVAIFGFMWLASAAIWPVFLVLYSLSSPKANQRQKATP